MVNSHKSTEEFYEGIEEEKSSIDMTALDDPELSVGERAFLMKKLTAEKPVTNATNVLPPLQRELNDYYSMKSAPINVDVLKWWKEHETKLPLLASLARSYFSIPVTSASSERMFSVGGNIVTDKRHNINPETLQMLLFVKENYLTLQPNIESWDLHCEGEPEDEPEPEPEPPAKEKTPEKKKTQPKKTPTEKRKSRKRPAEEEPEEAETSSASLLETQEPVPGTSKSAQRKSTQKDTQKSKCLPNPKYPKKRSKSSSYRASCELITDMDYGSDKFTSTSGEDK